MTGVEFPAWTTCETSAADAGGELGHSAQARPNVLHWSRCEVVAVVWHSVVGLCAPLFVTCSCEVLMDTSKNHKSVHVAAGQRKLGYDRCYH